MDKSSILYVMFWILQGLIRESIADCSAAELSISDVVSPRAGMHYVVIPNTNYVIPSSASSASPQSKCPSGSSLTYIKSQEEWEDWKYIRGSMYDCLKL